MPKRKVVETSREAFYSLDPDQLVGLRKKIFNTLILIGSGHYEDIAMAASIKPAQCWKRLSELEKFGMIHRTGERKLLSSNRAGFVWAPGGTPEPVKKKERVMRGKSVSEYSKAILNQPERLF
jgi:hypothetical protein